MAYRTQKIGALTAAVFGALASFAVPAMAADCVFLGDSLTDIGKFYLRYGPAGEDKMHESFTELYTADAADPIADGGGAFSNGDVWSELLSACDADLHNYAYSGASSGFYGEPARIPIDPFDPSTWPSDINFEDGVPTFEVPTGLLTQVGDLLTDLAGAELDADDVVFLQIGPNNYFFGEVFPNISNDPATVVGEIATAVGVLANDADASDGIVGAGARTIVVMNMPDLGGLALASILPLADNTQLGTASAVHNALLRGAMSRLRLQLDADIVVVDFYAAFKQIIGNPGRFGFTNVTDSCILVLPGSSVADFSGFCGDTPATFDPLGFLFWDMVHPTTAGHAALANFIAATLAGHAFGTAGFDSEASVTVSMCADPADGNWCY